MKTDDISKASDLISRSDKIVFFTGAGISTSCGIPDFRGPGGLYSFVQEKYNLPYPEAVFDISYFKENPGPFFELSKDFFSKNINPSPAHFFISRLEKQNKVSLVITQNIDMLHTKAGNKSILECHGTYLTGHCISCKKKHEFSDFEKSLIKGEVPFCFCGGVIKPDIVFFGEELPYAFYCAYQNLPECDLLVVMGTSLSVMPAAGIALKLVKNVPSIIVNLSETGYDHLFTYSYKSELNLFTKKIEEKL